MQDVPRIVRRSPGLLEGDGAGREQEERSTAKEKKVVSSLDETREREIPRGVKRASISRWGRRRPERVKGEGKIEGEWEERGQERERGRNRANEGREGERGSKRELPRISEGRWPVTHSRIYTWYHHSTSDLHARDFLNARECVTVFPSHRAANAHFTRECATFPGWFSFFLFRSFFSFLFQ